MMMMMMLLHNRRKSSSLLITLMFKLSTQRLTTEPKSIVTTEYVLATQP